MMSVGTVIICPIPTFSRPNKQERREQHHITDTFKISKKSVSIKKGQTKLSGVSGGFSLIRHMGRRGSEVFQEG